MRTLKTAVMLLLSFVATIRVFAQGSEKPTIIFVHGIWADGSCWSAQIAALQAEGYNVLSAQNPLTSLDADVATVKTLIDKTPGKIILVGHSWGGFVITQAGNDPKVVGLVFVAAFAPDQGEDIPTLSKNAPPSPLGNYLSPAGDYIFLTQEGVKTAFAADLSAKEQGLILATQIPANKSLFGAQSGTPAWKTKPSWYIISKSDKAINPDLERFCAKRANAKVTEIESSHVVMLSHPKEVLNIIKEAATTAK
jgi:pimeloyl-ACP methyl ester carboxylesterase